MKKIYTFYEIHKIFIEYSWNQENMLIENSVQESIVLSFVGKLVENNNKLDDRFLNWFRLLYWSSVSDD